MAESLEVPGELWQFCLQHARGWSTVDWVDGAGLYVCKRKATGALRSGLALPYQAGSHLSVSLTMAALYETVTRYHMPHMYRRTTGLPGATSFDQSTFQIGLGMSEGYKCNLCSL